MCLKIPDGVVAGGCKVLKNAAMVLDEGFGVGDGDVFDGDSGIDERGDCFQVCAFALRSRFGDGGGGDVPEETGWRKASVGLAAIPDRGRPGDRGFDERMHLLRARFVTHDGEAVLVDRVEAELDVLRGRLLDLINTTSNRRKHILKKSPARVRGTKARYVTVDSTEPVP